MIPYSISKEEVNELPLGQFEGEIYLIDHPDQVDEAVDFLEEQRIIGFDTETKPSFKKKDSLTMYRSCNFLHLNKPFFSD